MKSLMLGYYSLPDRVAAADAKCAGCGNQSISDVCVNQFVGPPARSLLCSTFLIRRNRCVRFVKLLMRSPMQQQKNPEKPPAKGIHSARRSKSLYLVRALSTVD